MFLIVGLGNPGEKYNNTPHNAGFIIVDKLKEKNDFPDFVLKKKLLSEISEKENVMLAKPQTFMNESGKAVKKLNNPNLIVVHDDIDLPLGKIKIVKDRGSAGHKGVESIVKYLGTTDFVRLRIGIQPETGKPKEPEKYVLKKKEFSKEVVDKSADCLNLLIEQGLERAMNEYNK